ncbi:MAG: TPM domain-containing protein [Sphingobacteriaceae bacterium]|nr:TPM domain-containing protein [Sphingobacteriaceae bacterium]MBK7816552.1 TPM domain-containing protein [Sphingobacteriaceae bacterium]
MLFKKKPLSKPDEQRLIAAIQTAEQQTSGEIRVHFDTDKVDSALDRAKQIFAKLKMHETELRNGILFYVNLKQKQFAVWGDEGINKNVPENFWDNVKDTAISNFKEGKTIDGLEKCILMSGEQLKKYFPLAEGDKNELKNDISY